MKYLSLFLVLVTPLLGQNFRDSEELDEALDRLEHIENHLADISSQKANEERQKEKAEEERILSIPLDDDFKKWLYYVTYRVDRSETSDKVKMKLFNELNLTAHKSQDHRNTKNPLDDDIKKRLFEQVRNLDSETTTSNENKLQRLYEFQRVANVEQFERKSQAQVTPQVVMNTPADIQKMSDLAKQGNGEAQNNLGYAYANGNGVIKDELEAYKWFLLASARGDANAKKNFPLIEEKLPSEQRIEGQRLAKEWQKKFETDNIIKASPNGEY